VEASGRASGLCVVVVVVVVFEVGDSSFGVDVAIERDMCGFSRGGIRRERVSGRENLASRKGCIGFMYW
jgi:hypothetical protein